MTKWKTKDRFHNKLCNRTFMLKSVSIDNEKPGRMLKLKVYINPHFLESSSSSYFKWM